MTSIYTNDTNDTNNQHSVSLLPYTASNWSNFPKDLKQAS